MSCLAAGTCCLSHGRSITAQDAGFCTQLGLRPQGPRGCAVAGRRRRFLRQFSLGPGRVCPLSCSWKGWEKPLFHLCSQEGPRHSETEPKCCRHRASSLGSELDTEPPARPLGCPQWPRNPILPERSENLLGVPRGGVWPSVSSAHPVGTLGCYRACRRATRSDTEPLRP